MIISHAPPRLVNGLVDQMNELPQRTKMKTRCTRMILEMTAKKECSTSEIYEAMNDRWPKHAPKKMTVARYCGELEKRGMLNKKSGKPTMWRFRTVVMR